MKVIVCSVVYLILMGIIASCSTIKRVTDLPNELRTLSSDILNRTNIALVGTFAIGRTPCEFLPDGIRRWMRTTGFTVDTVIRGRVTTSYIEVHLNAFVDQEPMPLLEGEKYYLLLSADTDLQERLQKADPLYFREALNDDAVVAVLDFNGVIKSAGSDNKTKQSNLVFPLSSLIGRESI